MKLTLALLLSAVASAQNYEQRIAGAISRVAAIAGKGPFHADWISLGAFQVPKWYQDAKSAWEDRWPDSAMNQLRSIFKSLSFIPQSTRRPAEYRESLHS